jgi:hypothetical protein
MDQILQNYWNSRAFAPTIGQTAFENWNRSGQYFFLSSELSVKTPVQYVEAIKNKKIRHCIPYNGKYYDYIVKKEFNTLAEWVMDADATANLEMVCYGTNHLHKGGQSQCITLRLLLSKYQFQLPLINPEDGVEPEEEEKIDLEFILDFHRLTLDNLWVIKDGDIKPFNTYLRTLV